MSAAGERFSSVSIMAAVAVTVAVGGWGRWGCGGLRDSHWVWCVCVLHSCTVSRVRGRIDYSGRCVCVLCLGMDEGIRRAIVAAAGCLLVVGRSSWWVDVKGEARGVGVVLVCVVYGLWYGEFLSYHP
jgi:hypothetical protein